MARCVDCGFLAARDYESRQLVEVDQEFRDSGSPTPRPGSVYHWQERAPVCFVQVEEREPDSTGTPFERFERALKKVISTPKERVKPPEKETTSRSAHQRDSSS